MVLDTGIRPVPGQSQKGHDQVELIVHDGEFKLPGVPGELVPAHPQPGHDLAPRLARCRYVGLLPAGPQLAASPTRAPTPPSTPYKGNRVLAVAAPRLFPWACGGMG